MSTELAEQPTSAVTPYPGIFAGTALRDAKPRFLAKSSLRREFREGAPVSATKAMCPVVDADGTLSIFSVGDDDDVYWLDELEDGRWETTSLGLKTRNPNYENVNSIDAFVDAKGIRHVAVTVTRRGGWIESGVYYMREQPMASTWRFLAGSGDPNTSVADAWFGPSPDGKETVLYCGLRFAGTGTCKLDYWKNLSKTPVRVTPDWLTWYWSEPWFHMHRTTGRFAGKSVVFTSAISRDRAYSDIGAFSLVKKDDVLPNRVVAHTDQSDPSYAYALAADDPTNKDYSALLCAMGPSKEPFGPRIGLQKLVLARQTATTRRSAEIPAYDACSYVLPRRDCLSYWGKPLDSGAPDTEAVGYELIACAEQNRTLVHLTETRDSGEWGKPSPMNQLKSSTSFAVCTGPSGAPIIVAILESGKTVKITRAEDGSWSQKQIVFVGTNQLQEYQAYVTEVTVVDGNDVPMPHVNVTLRSNHAPNELIVNHRAVMVDWQGVTVRTDRRGRLLISDEVDGLSTSVTHLLSDGVEPLVLDPVQPIYERLDAVSKETWQKLKAEKVPQTDGTSKQPFDKLDQKSAESALEGLKNTLTLARRDESFRLGSILVHPRSDPVLFPVGAGDVERDLDVIRAEQVPEQHWSISFDPDSGTLSYHDLTRHEAEARLHAVRAREPSLLGGMSWADMVQSLLAGFKSKWEVTVTTLGKAVEAVIKIGQEVWRGILNTVRQAYDLVRLIFGSIGAALEDLWAWLGDVFNWTDILLVRDGFLAAMDQTLTALTDGIKKVDTRFAAAGKEARARIAATFDGLIRDQIQAKTMDSYTAEAKQHPIDPKLQIGQETNVFAGAFESAIQSGQVRLAHPEAHTGPRLGGASWDQIVARIQTAESMPEFEKVTGYFNSAADRLKDDPRAFLRDALAGLLQLVSALLQAAVEITVEILHLIAGMVAEAVTWFKKFMTETTLDIPVLSGLYRQISNGRELTVGDLVALTMAIPASVAYKATHNREPMFKDANDVKALKAELAKLSSPQLAARAGDPVKPYFEKRWRDIGLMMVATGGAPSLMLTTLADLIDCLEPDAFNRLTTEILGGALLLADTVVWAGGALLDATTAWGDLDWFSWRVGGIGPVCDLLGLLCMGGSTVFVGATNRIMLAVGAAGAVLTLACLVYAKTGSEWTSVDTMTVLSAAPSIARLLRLFIGKVPQAWFPAVAATILVTADMATGIFLILVPIMSQARDPATGLLGLAEAA
jgi:hypothetical protein